MLVVVFLVRQTHGLSHFGNFSGAGVVPGNGEADLLMGMTGLGVHDQTYFGPTTGRRWKIVRPFVEDDWRATPSLTFNLGLAWDMTTPITEIHDRMSDYIFQTGQLLVAEFSGECRAGCDVACVDRCQVDAEEVHQAAGRGRVAHGGAGTGAAPPRTGPGGVFPRRPSSAQ